MSGGVVNKKVTMKEEINVAARSRCPRCDGMALKRWPELNDEEKEVVRRLPSGGYSLSERERLHRWCTRCWLEDGNEGERLA